jgi:hypothetical protein
MLARIAVEELEPGKKYFTWAKQWLFWIAGLVLFGMTFTAYFTEAAVLVFLLGLFCSSNLYMQRTSVKKRKRLPDGFALIAPLWSTAWRTLVAFWPFVVLAIVPYLFKILL